jgi:acyl-homoserine-lactone acylase
MAQRLDDGRRGPAGFRTRRSARTCLALSAALALIVASAALATTVRHQPKPTRQVTVTRDRNGIPHIVAKNFAALGLGEGYAFAQDNLCTFAADIVTVRAQRSKFFGPSALAVNYSAGTAVTNLQSDLYWRYVQASGIARRGLTAHGINGLLPQVRQVYTGFVAGYNRFLRSGKLRDPACKGKPWVTPITMTDMLLRGEQIVSEGSAQQFISDLELATPPPAPARTASSGHQAAAPNAASPQRRAAATNAGSFAALRAQFGDQADRAQGSNGIAIGARDTRSGHGMVLANPHFPWRGTERFWMAQLVVPGRYDVEGGTLMGFPLVGIGFNQHIAWTHTVSTSRRFVLYRLTLVPGHPTSYYLNGKPVSMGRVTVAVNTGSQTVRHTFYTTHWGLVLNVAAVPGGAYGWSPTSAYALYDAVGSAGPRAADQYLRMGQARSVRDLFNIEAHYLAIPTFNTIAADDRGNAYYGDVGATPAVSQAELHRCLPAGISTLVFAQARVVTLDGSQTSCAPATFRGTPKRGLFDAAHLPHAFRRDYLENSNDSYWLANPNHPLPAYSPIIGLTRTVQGLRTRIGNQMIQARVKGTDRLGAAKFTLGTLQRMWESDRSELAALVLRDLVSDCRAHPSQTASNGQLVDLTAACAALAGWDATGHLNAVGGWLFTVWNYLDGDSSFYATAFDPNHPLSTPRGLNTGSTATPLKWLADAVLNLRAHGLAPDASYRQVQHAPQSRAIPIHGCDTGCFNAIYSQTGTPAMDTPEDAAPYGQVYDGSSLVMTTMLTPGAPKAQGILTYSQATDPTSPWYSNMTRLYSRQRWVPLPYTAAALAASHPRSVFTLG